MPAGTIQVAIAISTISANRIVYAEGSLNPRLGSVGAVVVVSAMWSPPGAADTAAGVVVSSSSQGASARGTLKPR